MSTVDPVKRTGFFESDNSILKLNQVARTSPLCQLDWELHLDSEGQVIKLDSVTVSLSCWSLCKAQYDSEKVTELDQALVDWLLHEQHLGIVAKKM